MDEKQFSIMLALLYRIISDDKRGVVSKTQVKLAKQLGDFLTDQQREELFICLEIPKEIK
jgi:hypothetical protein